MLKVDPFAEACAALRDNTEPTEEVRGFRNIVCIAIKSIDDLGETPQEFARKCGTDQRRMWAIASHLAGCEVKSWGHAFTALRELRNRLRRFKVDGRPSYTCEDVLVLTSFADFLCDSELFLEAA